MLVQYKDIWTNRNTSGTAQDRTISSNVAQSDTSLQTYGTSGPARHPDQVVLIHQKLAVQWDSTYLGTNPQKAKIPTTNITQCNTSRLP